MIKFGGGIELPLDELKVIRHTSPIVLIGTDVLFGDNEADCKFCFVGCHPRTREGCMIAIKGDTAVEIALVGWPQHLDLREDGILPQLPL